MSARTKARKRALDILFSADVRGESVTDSLAAEARRAATEPARQASWLYARDIVDGYLDYRHDIDDLLEEHSTQWKLDRMPSVDRALLRVATWEIVYNDDVPAAVAIDEAIELAKEFSTEESGSFVHGVLARIAEATADTR